MIIVSFKSGRINNGSLRCVTELINWCSSIAKSVTTWSIPVFSSCSSIESSSVLLMISFTLDFGRGQRDCVVRFNGVFGTDTSEFQRSKK